MSNHVDSMAESFYSGFSEGERIGQQRIIDATMIYMARSGESTEKVLEYFREVNEIDNLYGAAFRVTQEQDIWQERMDEELRSVLGDGCKPFRERYPEIRSMGYDRRVHEQRHPAAKKKKKKKR